MQKASREQLQSYTAQSGTPGERCSRITGLLRVCGVAERRFGPLRRRQEVLLRMFRAASASAREPSGSPPDDLEAERLNGDRHESRDSDGLQTRRAALAHRQRRRDPCPLSSIHSFNENANKIFYSVQ